MTKDLISFQTLESLDIRICRVDKVSPILKNAKNPLSEDNPVKAYKLLIDTGDGLRECVTNLVSVPASQLEGSLFPFILNLPEAEIRGVRSCAMIVAAGKSTLLRPDNDATVGMRVF